MSMGVRFVLSYDSEKRFYCFKLDIFPMKNYMVVMDIVNDVTYSCKSYYMCGHLTFYYMTISTGKQRFHIINEVTLQCTSKRIKFSCFTFFNNK